MTPSHVIAAATSWPASPMAAALAGSLTSRLIAAASSPAVRRAHESVHAVDDELVRPARVGAGDHRLPREERLERDVAEVLIVRRIDHREGIGIQLDQVIVFDVAQKGHAIGDAGLLGRAFGILSLCAVAGDDSGCRTARWAIAAMIRSTRFTDSIRPTDST